jgi:hypothetical protein
VFVKITVCCAVCGIRGHGKVEILPTGGTGLPCLPRTWHVEAKDNQFVAHCSQLCLVHRVRTRVRDADDS